MGMNAKDIERIKGQVENQRERWNKMLRGGDGSLQAQWAGSLAGPVFRPHLSEEDLGGLFNAVALSDELFAVLPRCHYTAECPNIGVKWIARTVLNCDTHGSIYDLDAPWAELVRRYGRAGARSNVVDAILPVIP